MNGAGTMAAFSHDDFARLIDSTVEKIQQLSKLKGGEYAGDNDRLANFRRNALALGLPMETVWAVYAAKHWDAVMQFIQDLNTGKTRERMEPIDGRVDDLIVYLILFKAMLEERDASTARKPSDALSVKKPVFEEETLSW